MKRLSYIRYLTYVALIAIAVKAGSVRRFIEVRLEPQAFVPSVELSDWDGKDETWLRLKLSGARLWEDVTVTYLSRDFDSEVRAVITKTMPQYRGYLRHMRWYKDLGGWKSGIYDIYLCEEKGGWSVVTGRYWEEQMTG